MGPELVLPALDFEEVSSQIVAHLTAAGDGFLSRELRNRVASLLEKLSLIDLSPKRSRVIERSELLVARCWALIDACKIEHPGDQPLYERSFELLRRIRDQLARLDRVDSLIH